MRERERERKEEFRKNGTFKQKMRGKCLEIIEKKPHENGGEMKRKQREKAFS